MRRHGFTFLLGARASCPCRRDEGGTPALRMRIPQRAGAAAPVVRPARRFSIGRGDEAGSAACACIKVRNARADVNFHAECTKPRWRGAGAEHPHAPARARQRPSCFQPDA